MNNLHAYGELLTASEDELTLTYKLLPFGEEGSTSAGLVKASKGILTLPENVHSLSLNEEHDFKRPIGFFESLIEDETGLNASVRLIDTQAGRDAHKLAKAGLRTGISVEIAEPIISDGNLLAGRLTGAGLVVRPAFANAQLIAADCGTTLKDSSMETTSTLEAAEAVIEPTFVQTSPLLASDKYPTDFAQTLLAAATSGAGLTAALAEVHTDFDPAKTILKDQDLGTLWSARRVARPIAERFLKGAVTSLTLTGTRRTRVTTVADWAGNRVALPTSPGFTTSREFWSPTAKAVALGLSAEIVAFGDASIIGDLYADALDSYYAQTETIVINRLVADTTLGAVSASSGAIAAVNKAADTMNAIGANLDFVLVSPDVHAAIRDISASAAPWWLQNQGKISLSNSTISFEGGPLIVSSAALPPKTVIAGDARAIDFRESKDFRHGAHNLPVFGEDISLVKFYAIKTLDAGALIKFTNVTGA